jgi:hypothetical protein
VPECPTRIMWVGALLAMSASVVEGVNLMDFCLEKHNKFIW